MQQSLLELLHLWRPNRRQLVGLVLLQQHQKLPQLLQLSKQHPMQVIGVAVDSVDPLGCARAVSALDAPVRKPGLCSSRVTNRQLPTRHGHVCSWRLRLLAGTLAVLGTQNLLLQIALTKKKHRGAMFVDPAWSCWNAALARSLDPAAKASAATSRQAPGQAATAGPAQPAGNAPAKGGGCQSKELPDPPGENSSWILLACEVGNW